MLLTELDIIVRLTLASGLGALVGLEREQHNQPAGLRTHTILALGAALAMALSINLSIEFREVAPNGDPARLAAQVISGIGFLGAGAIIRFGTSIKGLTTATSLWTVAIIGLAVGAGHNFSALCATILLLGTLVILDRLEKKVIVGVSTRTVRITALDKIDLLDEIKSAMEELGIETKAFSFDKNITTNEITITIVAKIRDRTKLDPMIQRLSKLTECRAVSLE